MKSSRKISLSLLSTIALTIGLGWIYQQSSGILCYSKLAFIYAGNIIFWFTAIKPVRIVFEKQMEKRNLFASAFNVGLITLLFNQLIIYCFVEGLFAAFYSCESHILLSELILTNGLLSNFITFMLIIIGTSADKILQKFKRDASPASIISIKQNGITHRVNSEEIVKVEADNNAVHIYTSNKRFVQYGRLKDWEKQLSNVGLVRVHRSFIVNKNFIETYQSKTNGDGILTLHNGDRIRVSRNYRTNLYMHGKLITT